MSQFFGIGNAGAGSLQTLENKHSLFTAASTIKVEDNFYLSRLTQFFIVPNISLVHTEKIPNLLRVMTQEDQPVTLFLSFRLLTL